MISVTREFFLLNKLFYHKLLSLKIFRDNVVLFCFEATASRRFLFFSSSSSRLWSILIVNLAKKLNKIMMRQRENFRRVNMELLLDFEATIYSIKFYKNYNLILRKKIKMLKTEDIMFYYYNKKNRSHNILLIYV